jgi:hypothetical protein
VRANHPASFVVAPICRELSSRISRQPERRETSRHECVSNSPRKDWIKHKTATYVSASFRQILSQYLQYIGAGSAICLHAYIYKLRVLDCLICINSLRFAFAIHLKFIPTPVRAALRWTRWGTRPGHHHEALSDPERTMIPAMHHGFSLCKPRSPRFRNTDQLQRGKRYRRARWRTRKQESGLTSNRN